MDSTKEESRVTIPFREMNLFFQTTGSSIDFDLYNLILILIDSTNNEELSFRLFGYEYNGVRKDLLHVNQGIIDFLGKEEKESVIVEVSDFVNFSQFIGQSEEGYFEVLSSVRGNFLKIEIYDAYFWNISSKDEDFLTYLATSTEIMNLSPQIERD